MCSLVACRSNAEMMNWDKRKESKAKDRKERNFPDKWKNRRLSIRPWVRWAEFNSIDQLNGENEGDRGKGRRGGEKTQGNELSGNWEEKIGKREGREEVERKGRGRREKKGKEDVLYRRHTLPHPFSSLPGDVRNIFELQQRGVAAEIVTKKMGNRRKTQIYFILLQSF
jgi:hypothetical protein